jgi:hypothetical protein
MARGAGLHCSNPHRKELSNHQEGLAFHAAVFLGGITLIAIS